MGMDIRAPTTENYRLYALTLEAILDQCYTLEHPQDDGSLRLVIDGIAHFDKDQTEVIRFHLDWLEHEEK